jgi:hypothetical protein
MGCRPLLELPVEHVLATHGGPFDRAALERARCPPPSLPDARLEDYGSMLARSWPSF